MIDRYPRPEMGAVWTEENRYRKWLDVELAACEAMEAEGLVPAGTAHEAPETPSVATAVAQLLRAGTSSRSAAMLTADVERLGGRLTGTAARDFSASPPMVIRFSASLSSLTIPEELL